jgi:hypothetical protein
MVSRTIHLPRAGLTKGAQHGDTADSSFAGALTDISSSVLRVYNER